MASTMYKRIAAAAAAENPIKLSLSELFRSHESYQCTTTDTKWVAAAAAAFVVEGVQG